MLVNSRPVDWFARRPVNVFHHVPKCGGTSVRNGLARWFIPVMDYGKPGDAAGGSVDLRKLRARHVLCGHYASAATNLAVRYPEIVSDPDDFRVFTFLRDPLEHRISHYYHTLRIETRPMPPLETWITDFGPNLLAESLGCNAGNWRRVLQRYCFVGLVEDLQRSFNRLAIVLSKRPIKLAELNRSPEADQLPALGRSLRSRFEADNALDYEIYDSVKASILGSSS